MLVSSAWLSQSFQRANQVNLESTTEQQLIRKLLQYYEPSVRPVVNAQAVVKISFRMEITQLFELVNSRRNHVIHMHLCVCVCVFSARRKKHRSYRRMFVSNRNGSMKISVGINRNTTVFVAYVYHPIEFGYLIVTYTMQRLICQVNRQLKVLSMVDLNE